ncbi:hypothetical protein FZEAL_1191 [Fusarium zealandicum]|uniref:Clr5 domain-containing protein n=1 Tax=Fusarium zealandicum TaxID=1053134 RepID=A0A8H4UU71_9HYPO|nr:hypothetical protein FZEAL_1191 [Fusarium zealandicum]
MEWKLYEKDAMRWYLDESKTAQETIKLLTDKHNIRVTERMFKAKFGRLKNLHANEWCAVIAEIRKREARGLKSAIYIHGKHMGQQSTARAIRRYSKLLRTRVGEPEPGIDLGIDTVGRHRIEIRTPAGEHDNIAHETSVDVQGSASEALEESSEPLIGLQLDLGDADVDFSGDFISGDALCLSPSMFLHLDDSIPQPSGESFWIHDGQTLNLENGSAVSRWRPGHFLMEGPSSPLSFQLLNKPRQPFRSFWDLSAMLSLSLDSSELTAAVNRRKFLAANLNDREFIMLARKSELLSILGLPDFESESIKPAVEYVEQVMLLPIGRRRDLGSSLLELTTDQSLYQIFTVLAYLASNNIFSEEQTWLYVSWLIRKNYMPKLLSFLQLSSGSILAFASVLLGDICSKGFLSLVESHQHDIPGPLGSRLLHMAVLDDNIELAKLVVSHGADVNFGEISYATSCPSPLARATSLGRISMVRYLIGVGADLDRRFIYKYQKATALTIAVSENNYELTQTLLAAGARITDVLQINGLEAVPFLPICSPAIRTLLQKSLQLTEESNIFNLARAARRSNRELSKALLQHPSVPQSVLNRAMCYAIEGVDVSAIGTFLRHGADPNTGLRTLQKSIAHGTKGLLSRLPYDSEYALADLIHLLITAGAKMDPIMVLKMCSVIGSRFPRGVLDVLRV